MEIDRMGAGEIDEMCYVLERLNHHKHIHIDRFYTSIDGRTLGYTINVLIALFELQMAERDVVDIRLTPEHKPDISGEYLELYVRFLTQKHITTKDIYDAYTGTSNWAEVFWAIQELHEEQLIEYRDGGWWWMGE